MQINIIYYIQYTVYIVNDYLSVHKACLCFRNSNSIREMPLKPGKKWSLILDQEVLFQQDYNWGAAFHMFKFVHVVHF